MKKIVPITGLILSMTLASVSAATEITKNNFDVNTGVLTIEGVTDNKGGMVSLNIPKAGITASQLDAMSDLEASNNLLYCEQITVGEDGKFRFTVTIPQGAGEGEYNISLGGETDITPEETTFYNINKDDYRTLIAALNTAAKNGQAAFDTLYDANGQKLFSYSDITAQGNDVIKQVLCEYARSTGFSETDSIANMSVYKTALASQLMKENRLQDAEKLFDSMYVQAEGVLVKYSTIADYKNLINTDQKRTYFASVFGVRTNITQFERALADGVILTMVRYSENVTDLKEIFEKYKDYTGAETDKAGLSDYNSISGKQFGSISACVSTFNAGLGNNQGGGGAGGGGGACGGGGGSSKPVADPSDNVGIAPPGGNGQTAALSIKFEDLNSVQWAYSAISELYERKIVSGKSETRFAPNDRVKREEFAKMMVDMAGLDIDNSANVFSDVNGNAWYKGYVNTAYKKGFLSGVGNGVFGAGMEISRQDMCVIAYNVLKKLGYEIPQGDLVFQDAGEFGDYAKTAVAALNKAGIVNGVGDNRFNPRGSATRAEAAVIIYKLLNYIE